MSHVAVVDFGLSNLDSVRRALESCGARVSVLRDPDGLGDHDHVVLPGVGAFDDAMKRLRAAGFDAALAEVAARGEVPILGLCLGMQLLAARGNEREPSQGLALIPGEVVRIEPVNGERLPHIGWNEVDPSPASPLFEGIAEGSDFYFVHSFHFRCEKSADVQAQTPYAGGITSVVGRGLVHGVQFHPEKSQKNGFALLRNFLAL